MKQLLFFLLCISSLFAQSNKVEALPEYTLKAAYVYNFALLTDWPHQDTESFSVCLFDNQPFSEAFKVLEQKRIGKNPISIRFIQQGGTLSGCRILFLSKHERNRNQNTVNTLAKEPILTVTDDEGLTQAHIQILQHNERLVFSINLGALQKSNLTLSSRLLQLAKEVTP